MDYTSLIKEVDIPELVKALRECGTHFICEDNCPRYYPSNEYVDNCRQRLSNDAAAAIEELKAEVQFYKSISEEWQEAAERKDRLLGMYRAQNIYSAKDASGHLVTNLCSLNRSEIPNNPENPES